MQDKQKFIEILGTAAEVYGSQLSEILLDVYWNVLKPFSDEDVAKAFEQAIRTLKWMPKPSEILEIMEGPLQSRPSEALQCLISAMKHVGAYRSVVFEDKAIHGVVEAWGGWMEVCRLTNDELRYKGKEFKELYQSYRNKPVDIPKLVGRIEADNTLAGYPEWIEEPVYVGFQGGQIQIENKYHQPRQITEGETWPDEEITPDDWETLRAGAKLRLVEGGGSKTPDGHGRGKPGPVDPGGSAA